MAIILKNPKNPDTPHDPSCKHPRTGGRERKEENPMSLRKQAKILGIPPPYLSLLLNGKRPWRGNLEERYLELVSTFVNTLGANTAITNGPTRLASIDNPLVANVY